MWARIWALAIKELLALLRDKKSRFVVIGPPIIQLLIFSYAASFDLNHVRYAVYNEDPGFASRALLAHVAGSPTFEKVKTIQHSSEVAQLINHQEVLLVLHIGRDFTRNLLQHRSAPMQVVIDGRNSNTATMAMNYISNIIVTFNEQWAATHRWQKPPSQLVIRAWYNPNLLSRWFIVPGIVAVIMLLETLLVTGLSVARERDQGTFDQLLVTPMTPLAILFGKALPGLIIGALQGTFIVIMAILWFQVPFMGSVLALAIGMILFILAAIGIGLMISAFANTQQQGLLGVFLFMVPAIILSGFATPIANMHPLVQQLTYINPVRYILIIIRGVFLEGDNIAQLGSQFWPLAIIAVLTMSVATWLFRNRL